MLKQTLTTLVAAVLTGGLLVSFGFTAVTPGPQAIAKEKKSKAEEEKERRAKIQEKYVKEKKGRVFHDHNYWLDLASLEDPRWKVPEKSPFTPISEERGVHLYGKWVPANLKGEPAITVRVTKYATFVKKGGTRTNFNMEFKYIGEAISMANTKKLFDAFWREWLAESSDPIKKQQTKPRKKKFGPASLYAMGTATDAELKDKVRREFYMWTGDPGAVYLATVTYHKTVLEQDKLLAKGPEFIKAISEIKK